MDEEGLASLSSLKAWTEALEEAGDQVLEMEVIHSTLETLLFQGRVKGKPTLPASLSPSSFTGSATGSVL